MYIHTRLHQISLSKNIILVESKYHLVNPKTKIQKHNESKLNILCHFKAIVDFWCRTLVIARERKREEILCYVQQSRKKFFYRSTIVHVKGLSC